MRYVGRSKTVFAILGLAAMMSLIAACGGDATATPTATATQPSAGATATPSEAMGEAWEEEWAQVLEDAKAEGQIVIVMGGSASQNYAPLFEDFQSETGIEVVPVTGRGSQQVEKFRAEREAGLYTGDVWMTGVTSTNNARELGIVEPLREDVKIIPEVWDPDNWEDGHLWFADSGTRNTIVTFCASPSPQFAYNTDLVDPSELTSYWDLVDGRFEGQIIGTLPWEPGQTNSDFYINNDELGEEYIRKVLDPATGVTWVADGQQAVDELVFGSKKIFMYQGNASDTITDMASQGQPVKNHFGAGFKEGGVVSIGGTCSFSLFNQPAHPNAVKVFVNWWLGKDNLYKAQGITTDQSLRVDIEPDNIAPEFVRSENPFFPEMDDTIEPNAGLEFNRQVADEYGLR